MEEHEAEGILVVSKREAAGLMTAEATFSDLRLKCPLRPYLCIVRRPPRVCITKKLSTSSCWLNL